MNEQIMKTMKRTKGVLFASVLIMGLAVTIVHAQGPDGGGPPPPMGMEGPMGRGMGGPPPQRVSAATIAVSVLTTELGLSSSQQAKIGTIQQTFQDARRELAPPPPRLEDSTGQDAGPPPAPPAPPSDATREKIRALETDALKQIEDILTDTQKTTLASLIQTMRALQSAGISPRSYPQLNLTSDQKTQIVSAADAQRVQDKAAIAKANDDPDALQSILGDSHRKLHDAVMAILTDAQKRIARSSGNGGGNGRGRGPRRGQGPDGQGPQDGNGPPSGGPGGFGPQDGNGPPPPMGGPGGPGDGGPGDH